MVHLPLFFGGVSAIFAGKSFMEEKKQTKFAEQRCDEKDVQDPKTCGEKAAPAESKNFLERLMEKIMARLGIRDGDGGDKGDF